MYGEKRQSRIGARPVQHGRGLVLTGRRVDGGSGLRDPAQLRRRRSDLQCAQCQMDQMIVAELVKALATWGQFLMPLLLLAGL